MAVSLKLVFFQSRMKSTIFPICLSSARNVVQFSSVRYSSEGERKQSIWCVHRRDFHGVVRRCDLSPGLDELNKHKPVWNLCCKKYASSERGKDTTKQTNSPGVVAKTFIFFNNITESILLKISPKLHALYKQFISGSKNFIADMRYVRALNSRIRRERIQLKDLHWKDIFMKDEIQRDMGKVIPTLIVSMLPMAFYVVLPVVFAFPRPFLSDHFFNKDQLQDHWKSIHERRLRHHLSILKYLKKSKKLKQSDVLDKVKNKQLVTEEEIRDLHPLFVKNLRLGKLSRPHLVSLCRVHSVLTFSLPSWFICMRLSQKVKVLSAMDEALSRENISELPMDDLEKLCHQRGFKVCDVEADLLQECLNMWLRITAELKDNKSLYLHLPLLLQVVRNMSDT